MPRPRPGVAIERHVPGSAWQDRGTCRGLDPDIFYPIDGVGAEAAKRICASCPVRTECLEYALELREKFGVWGGTSEHERRRILRTRNAQAA